jgi:hypothetical protein
VSGLSELREALPAMAGWRETSRLECPHQEKSNGDAKVAVLKPLKGNNYQAPMIAVGLPLPQFLPSECKNDDFLRGEPPGTGLRCLVLVLGRRPGVGRRA